MESSDESLSERGSFASETASHYDEELEEYSANDVAIQPLDGSYSTIGHAAISADNSKGILNEDSLLRGVQNKALFRRGDLELIVTQSEQSTKAGIGKRKMLEPMGPNTKGSNLRRPPSRKPANETSKPG